jgi:hypothetical protein
MRSLANSRVLAQAGAAALITSLACIPRLETWPARANPLWFSWLLLLWANFMLWSFVFGWHVKYAQQHPLTFPRQPRLWVMATAWGLAECAWLCLVVDPRLRILRPEEYPASGHDWLASSLFTVAFDPLFLCFAPFAFFVRLSRRQTAAVALTVMFAIFVQFMKLDRAPRLSDRWLVASLMTTPILASFASVYFYLRGGAWLVWWIALLTQLRLLPSLLR